MVIGDFYGLLGYGLFSSCDALVKGLGTDLSAYEVNFWLTFFWAVPLSIPFARSPDWGVALRPAVPTLTWARGLLASLASLCGVLAFTNLPLADAYAILFLLPMWVAILASLILGEIITPMKWISIALGLIGVLVAVRPGFQTLGIGHLAALAGAVLGASTIITMRKIGTRETQLTMMMTMWLMTLVVNGVLMAPTFRWPQPQQWLMLLGAGTAAGVAQLLTARAIRHIAANRMGPLQYSQILWAVVLGASFFGEVPDFMKTIGIMLVIASGIMNIAQAQAT